MTPHTWDISLWAKARLDVIDRAEIVCLCMNNVELHKKWRAEREIYAEILALSIYADEQYWVSPRVHFDNKKDWNPHALLDWLRGKKAKKEGE